jgi:hypothetical protein
VRIDLHDCGRRDQEQISQEQADGVALHLLDQSMWGRQTQRPSKHFESVGGVIGGAPQKC